MSLFPLHVLWTLEEMAEGDSFNQSHFVYYSGPDRTEVIKKSLNVSLRVC